jgi:thiol-disulfide isomerase/thioredoxin
LAGESTTLAGVAQGQPMVVNLWASWCPPCRREMPVLAAAQQQEKGMTFVFVNQGEGAGTALHYLSSQQLDLRHVLFDAVAQLGHATGSSALPTTFFYDADGRLVDTHFGELSKASLASKLAKLRTAGSR